MIGLSGFTVKILMENLSFISWNIRGVRSATAINSIKSLIHSHNPGMICLQETKTHEILNTVKDYIWPIIDHDWIFAPSSGLSGGLLITWDKTMIVKKDSSFIKIGYGLEEQK